MEKSLLMFVNDSDSNKELNKLLYEGWTVKPNCSVSLNNVQSILVILEK